MNRNYNNPLQLISQMPKAAVTIGYYPIRGKAQVCRLLCEYLGVDYEDRLFTLAEWEKQKKQKLRNNSIKQLPYLQQGNFKVAGSIPMCLYIIDRFSNGELLGHNLKDQALVDMYLWTIDAMSGIIKMNCQKKSQEEIRMFKHNQWRNVVAPKLQKYEQFAKQNEWFLGYLTIIDFSIYQLIRYIELIFDDKIEQFPKLKEITRKIGDLQQIKSYEASEHAVREMCPTTLLKQVKEQNKDERCQIKSALSQTA